MQNFGCLGFRKRSGNIISFFILKQNNANDSPNPTALLEMVAPRGRGPRPETFICCHRPFIPWLVHIVLSSSREVQ